MPLRNGYMDNVTNAPLLNLPLLIEPKVERPALSSNYLPRERLLNELKAQQDRPLIVISGPAGYGKTTLMSAWLAESEWPVAWVSLDEEDNNLWLFALYVVSAIQEHFPNAMRKTAALLHAITLPDETLLGRTLINELDHIDSSFTLALDDYHTINDKAIHKLIVQIVRYPPRTLHLVIATRNDPPLPLSTLRSHGKMGEIRTNALRFTEEESVMMLERVSGMPLSASITAILNEQLDGWAAGLHVAGLTLRHKPAMLALKPQHFTTHLSVMEYLFAEVLQRQPAPVQAFLIQTSILDQLNQPLCDAVMGQTSAACEAEEACLTYLVQRNLFVSTVNEEEGAYRYHHLFRKLLNEQLKARYSTKEIVALHGRASDWHAGHGQPDNALRYALRVKDYARAEQIISRYRHQLMNDDEWQQLEHWLGQMPREIVNASPDLLVAETYIAQVRFRRNEMSALLKQVDNLVEGMPQTPELEALKGEAASLHSQYLFESGEIAKALEQAQVALRLTPHDRWQGRTVAWLTGGSALLVQGDRAGALEWVYRGFAEEHDQGDGFRLRLMVVLCFMHAYTGDLAELKHTATEALRIASDTANVASKGSNMANWVRYHLAMAHYHRNELAEAEELLSVVIAQRHESYLNCAIHSMFMLALMHQAQGRPDEANRMADLAAQHALEMLGTRLLPVIDMFKAQLALQQGQVSNADQRVADLDLPKMLPPMWAFYIPYLTFSKVQLAVGTPESFAKAEAILKQLHAHMEQQHNPRVLIEVLVQEALLADANHDQRAALMALERALMMAEPHGYIRLFVDHGSRMAQLLPHVHSRNVSPGYIQHITKAFKSHDANDGFRAQSRLVEPLSNREMQVLEQLYKRMSSKEIADSLYISPGTVKRHIHTIYEKLDVSTRRDAVIKALDLNLLSYQ